MKKKIIGSVLIAAIAVAAGWNFNQSKNEMRLSELALTNVEALANGESGNYDCIKPYTYTFSYEGSYKLSGVKYNH